MKTKEMFKKWYFWVAIAVYVLIRTRSHINYFGNVLLPEFIGILIGCFIVVSIFGLIIIKIGNRRKNK